MTPRLAEPPRATDTETAILVAARDLLAEGGLDALSMRAVAARVGISATAIYNYFTNKQALVRRVAGLLRVADGLDRGHTAVVDQVSAELSRKKLVLRITPGRAGANMALEGWAARRKADVLQKVLGRKITITASLAPAVKPRKRPTPRTAPRRS